MNVKINHLQGAIMCSDCVHQNQGDITSMLKIERLQKSNGFHKDKIGQQNQYVRRKTKSQPQSD